MIEFLQCRASGLVSLGAILAMAAGAAAQDYTFTTDVGPITSVSTGYFDYNGDGTPTLASGNGSVAMAAIGIDVSQIDGSPVSEFHIAFCMELEQPVSNNTTYTYQFEDDPANFRSFKGGLSNVQVGQLNYLFDNYYVGPVLGDWGSTNGIRNEYIFQLSLWEITHDTDMALFDNTGSFYFTGSAAAVLEAQSVLDTLTNSGTDFSTYQSTSWDIQGLTHPTNQDLMFAEAIPEPASAMLLMIAGLVFLTIRRPRRNYG